MISCTDCTDEYCITFHVMASEKEKRLWIDVWESNPTENYNNKTQFGGDEYGQALTYFEQRQSMLHKKYKEQ